MHYLLAQLKPYTGCLLTQQRQPTPFQKVTLQGKVFSCSNLCIVPLQNSTYTYCYLFNHTFQKLELSPYYAGLDNSSLRLDLPAGPISQVVTEKQVTNLMHMDYDILIGEEKYHLAIKDGSFANATDTELLENMEAIQFKVGNVNMFISAINLDFWLNTVISKRAL